MPFSASAIFCFISSTLAKCFPLRSFYIRENKKKCCLGKDGVNREGRAWGSCHFLVKNCWTLSTVWAGVLLNYPSWNGQICSESSKKNSLKPHTASHNNTNWYTDTDGFLEHSPSGGSLLQGTCPPEDYSRVFFGGVGFPSYSGLGQTFEPNCLNSRSNNSI